MTALTGMRLTVHDVWVTVRTPVHIGSGIVLRRDADFVLDAGPSGRKQVRVIDVDAALERMSDEEVARIQGGLIAKALHLRTRDLVTRRVLTYQDDRDPPEIREHISLVDGTPYLPGSSLKGALRSAVLAQLVEQRGQEEVPADGRAVEQLARVERLAHEAAPENRDILRLIRISDLVPERPERALALVRAQARPLAPRMGRPAGGIPIWCQALAPGTRLRGTLGMERGSPLHRSLDDKQRNAVMQLPTVLRAFAVRIARYERAAYAAAGRMAPPLFEEIEAGQGRAGGSVWCNIGWGGGWQVKTMASVLPDRDWEEAARKVRARFQAQGPVPRPFPSSRRVAVTEREEVPMGWVHLAIAKPSDGRPAS